MSIPINTNYDVGVPAPFDARTQVQEYGDLEFIPVVFIGLKVFVVDDNAEYRYYSNGWQLWNSQGGGGAVSSGWGSITGDINTQVDLGLELNKKYNKTGGLISGNVDVQGAVDAYNFILAGSTASSELSPFAKLVDVPLTATSSGLKGELALDEQFAYFCVLENTWRRVAITTWS